MQKSGKCFACQTTLHLPKSECIVKCFKCNTLNLILCHPIRIQNLPLIDILCLECGKKYCLITCHKCDGTMVLEAFKEGFPYRCGCGHKRIYLSCPNCKSILALSTRENYRKSLICCKKCAITFRYNICPKCLSKINYKEGSDSSSDYNCSPFCQKEMPKNQLLKDPMSNNNIQIDKEESYSDFAIQTNQDTKPNRSPKTPGYQVVCKVCLDKEANMINDKCYHMSVCEVCSKLLKNGCPICRAQGGMYHKVFKS